MKNGVLNIKVDYKPLNVYKNVVVKSGSTRQNYNANTRYFEPDRRIDPYVVLIECGVNDTHKLAEGLVNEQLTDVSWKISSPAGYKEIVSTDKEFRIGTGADKGLITIFKNVSDLEPVTLLFTARFMEPTTKRVVNFQESFTLITLPIAEAPLLVETAAPVGYNLFPTQNNQGLICQADLYRGKDKVPAAYWWYNGQYEIGNIEGYQGQYTNKLFIDGTKINKSGTIIKAEVADCSEYFNGLVRQKVEADAQVIQWLDLFQNQYENLASLKDSVSWGLLLAKRENNIWKLSVPPGGGSTGIELKNKVFNKVSGVCMLSFKIKKISGDIFTINGESSPLTYPQKIYIDGVLKGSTNFTSTSVPYPNDNLEHTVTIISSVNTASSSSIYIQPNRRSNNYGYEYNADVYDIQVKELESDTIWSPSKEDLQDLITQKTEHYKSNTSLPENYRPNPKPAKLYTADFMLMKKLPAYTADVLYPTTVSPESTTVQIEMVLNTNDGVIKQPEQFFSVGWLKQANGAFKYKGFKVKIAIADIKALNDANKQLDYELREDLTLKA